MFIPQLSVLVARATRAPRPDPVSNIEAFYNRRRWHSSPDYLCLEAHEQIYRQQHEFHLTRCLQNRGKGWETFP